MKKSFWRLGCAAAFAFLLVQSSLAQKLVDPNSVAPEFRAAAEKRRAEQLKLNECTKKAIVVKVLERDRTAFISSCVDSPDQTANSSRSALHPLVSSLPHPAPPLDFR